MKTVIRTDGKEYKLVPVDKSLEITFKHYDASEKFKYRMRDILCASRKNIKLSIKSCEWEELCEITTGCFSNECDISHEERTEWETKEQKELRYKVGDRVKMKEDWDKRGAVRVAVTETYGDRSFFVELDDGCKYDATWDRIDHEATAKWEPKEEIRDQFLEDHRELIEKSKPLL